MPRKFRRFFPQLKKSGYGSFEAGISIRSPDPVWDASSPSKVVRENPVEQYESGNAAEAYPDCKQLKFSG